VSLIRVEAKLCRKVDIEGQSNPKMCRTDE